MRCETCYNPIIDGGPHTRRICRDCFEAPQETSEVPTKWRRGGRIVHDGQMLEFIEAEIGGEKWAVIGPAPRQ